jgi:hypothetical protein
MKSETTFFKVTLRGQVYLVCREKHRIGRAATWVYLNSADGKPEKDTVRRIREAIEKYNVA